MRGLFYQHRPWQKLNCLTTAVAALLVLFFHGILNLLSRGPDVLASGQPSVASIISSSQVQALLTEPAYWSAQFQGLLSIFGNIGLWLHIVWLPVSIAFIILIRALCTLTARPRWQASIMLMLAGFAGLYIMQAFNSPADSARHLATGPAVALYFSFAAMWTSASRLRGANAY